MAGAIANLLAYDKLVQMVKMYERFIVNEKKLLEVGELIRLVNKHNQMAEALRRRIGL